MWHYMWPHLAYHVARVFPRYDRLKIRVLLIVLSFAILVPQLVVMTNPRSSRFCGSHLLELLVASVLLTFFSIGFATLFSLLEPVPPRLKACFHAYGVVVFVYSLVFVVETLDAGECKTYSPELFWLSTILALASCFSLASVAVLAPFWALNYVKPLSVFDPKQKAGVCYEPVACCSCMWNV